MWHSHRYFSTINGLFFVHNGIGLELHCFCARSWKWCAEHHYVWRKTSFVSGLTQTQGASPIHSGTFQWSYSFCFTVQQSSFLLDGGPLSIAPIPFKYTSCIYTAIKSSLKVRFSMSTQSWTLGKLHSTPEKGVKGGHLKDLLTSNRLHTCIFFSMIKPSLLCSCIPSALMTRWQINAMI